jgi:hypothetical protein
MKPHCALCEDSQTNKNISRQAIEPQAVTSKNVRFEFPGGIEICELSGLIRGLAILAEKPGQEEGAGRPARRARLMARPYQRQDFHPLEHRTLDRRVEAASLSSLPQLSSSAARAPQWPQELPKR